MPFYMRYKKLQKECENLIEDTETGKKRKCGKPFETTIPNAKYCPECRLTKSWGTPAVKRLAA